VVLDDCSEDDTVKLTRSFEKAVVYENERPLFAEDESALRSRLWNLTIKENLGWIAAIDADEIMEDRIIDEVRFLIDQDYYDAIYFRVFDFWASQTHYRKDGGWDPWAKFWPFMVRYKPDINYFRPRREMAPQALCGLCCRWQGNGAGIFRCLFRRHACPRSPERYGS